MFVDTGETRGHTKQKQVTRVADVLFASEADYRGAVEED